MKRLGVLISGLACKLELSDGQKRQKALEKWDLAVGKDLGRLAVPAGFRKSLLLVSVSHPAAAMEVRLRKTDILDSLNRSAGKVLFENIKILIPSMGKR